MTVRGGLDDALHKLARRDELRRRAAGETPSTPPAVTELVEAIAAVISRHPELGVTVGVEGAGDPVLLHFGFADGVVQVSADNTVATRAAETTPKHADFEIDVDAEQVYEAPQAYPAEPAYDAGQSYPAEPPRASHDDQDRFGPTDFDYQDPPTAERPFVAPHPFAATPPPPVPPQTSPYEYESSQGHADIPYSAPPQPAHSQPAYIPPQAQGPAPHAEPVFTEPAQAEPQPGFPPPLAKPIPLQVERPEETEQAVRRLAALLRNDPSLLDAPHD